MGDKVKQTIIKGVKIVAKPFIILSIAVIVLVTLFWGVVNNTYKIVSKVFNDVRENIKISGNNIEIDQDYLKEAKERLERMGINSETLGLELPNTVDLVVAETEPNIKGDTSSGGSKPATMETGLVVQVPFFINEGDTLTINTSDGTYISRA